MREFYYRKHTSLFWFSDGSRSSDLREQLWRLIDSSWYRGLDSSRYHYASIRNNRPGIPSRIKDSLSVIRLDKIFTDAAISLCKDIYQGKDVYDKLGYDQLSAESSAAGGKTVLEQLIQVTSGGELSGLIDRMEPETREYASLKRELASQLDSVRDPLKIRKLASSMDYYRWIAHFRLSRYILVNIASATLRYYENDTLRLKMKIVAGKPSTPTPRFSALCRQVILYPYWHVPRRIALNELLPLFQTVPGILDEMGMQLINADGNIIDYHTLPWATFSKSNFPYSVRQSAGCGNALGVVKFDLTDPFDVYMHDTNLKSAFASASRYYSHGCIRLEKPNLLATYLLGNQLDTTLLTQCLKDQKPMPIKLENPVPVLVVYITAEADEEGKTVWYKDIYHLLAKK